jgi:Tfp pilus assembly protein PilE
MKKRPKGLFFSYNLLMLGEMRGFTVIQFIIGATVLVLLVLAIFMAVARKSQRDSQRRGDLALVQAMIERYAETHHGVYPRTNDAADPGSPFHAQFDQLSLKDPQSNKYYTLGTDFDDCDGSSTSDRGPGYIAYARPGENGAPYKLRICLEQHGEYYFGNQ